MSYLVLARKYRPQTFDGVIGQEHITGLVKKAIETGRIAHAFLFCGPRGIGKTSCARILAKSLNCQNGPTLTPCGTCFACQEISGGNSFDVIEIDGASNRGIEEIRTLRENVKFAPSYGRFKIYIVDEVHMLTSEAFNALLKTLEEPPEHVKFIFATTEANKVPSTIISRCQRFDFKRISIEAITKNLKDICSKENFQVDDDALYAIAKASQGSMRDALSILDQLGALSQRQIIAEDVFSMLGMVEVELIFRLVDALADKNCSQALEAFDDIIERGKDIKQLSKDLTEHFRNLMVIKVGGKALQKLVDYPVAVKEMLLKQSERLTLGEILRSLEFLIEAQDTARITESLRLPLEVAFAKMTYRKDMIPPAPQNYPSAPSVTTAPVKLKTPMVPEGKSPQNPTQASLQTATAVVPDAEPASVEIDGAGEEAASALTLEQIRATWNALTHEVSRKKMSVATFLQEASPYACRNGKLTLAFQKDQIFHKESLEERDNKTLVEKIFSEKLRQPITIEYVIVETYHPKDDEPVVKTALSMFKGKVVNQWYND